MTMELAQIPDVMTLGKVFASSGYFQDAREAAQAVVKILAGQELGFGPVASMTGMYIVKGKVSMSANLIAAAVKRGKYNYRVLELTDKACKIDFYERKEKIGESAFSMEDARVAGLVNENYKKFARNMLFARAMSNGAKWFCADIFGGAVYTPDELGATVDGETGDMTARPPDEVIAPVPPEAHPPAEPPTQGDMTELLERSVLIAEMNKRMTEIGMSAADFLSYKKKRGVTDVGTCDLAALRDLRDDLRHAR